MSGVPSNFLSPSPQKKEQKKEREREREKKKQNTACYRLSENRGPSKLVVSFCPHKGHDQEKARHDPFRFKAWFAQFSTSRRLVRLLRHTGKVDSAQAGSFREQAVGSLIGQPNPQVAHKANSTLHHLDFGGFSHSSCWLLKKGGIGPFPVMARAFVWFPFRCQPEGGFFRIRRADQSWRFQRCR